MDHLPTPLQPFNSPPKAPLVTRTDYDHELSDFVGYPEREKWYPRPADEWRKVFRSGDPDFLSFLQRWLYFGQLECALGRTVSVSSFTRDGQYLSSQGLLQLANESIPLTPDSKHVRISMNHARNIHLGLFKHFHLPETPDSNLSDEVSLQTFIDRDSIDDPRDPASVTATSLLIDFLNNFVFHRWSFHDRGSFDHPKLIEFKTGPLWEDLKRKGWCISEASALLERFSVSGIYFMTQVCPPNPDHHKGNNSCNHFKCELRQLNDSTYKTKHVSGCDEKCGGVGAHPEKLASILVDQDTIPLIDASAPWSHHNRTPAIELVAWDVTKPFVAISHVWADGIGNPNANALPRCQMIRLSRMVQGLTRQKQSFFWLDTICVPPDTALNNSDPAFSQKQRVAQDRAITKMRQTYEESAYVLVLDAWILSSTNSKMTDVEKLMRIFSSGWNTRLWTYQEGALAKRLFFELKDETYDIDEAIDRIRQSQDWSVNFSLQGSLIEQYDSLRGFRSQTHGNTERIRFLAHALSCRTTSVSSDEALCLSTLMGFNVQDILDVNVPDPKVSGALANARMKKFWATFTEVPLAIMRFDGPTVAEKGWGWAPSSLLLSKDKPINVYRKLRVTPTDQAVRTSLGLEVHLPGLEFRSSVPLGLEFHLEDENHIFHHINFTLTRYKNLAREYRHNHSGNLRQELCLNPRDVAGTDTLAFIFDPIDRQDDLQTHSTHVLSLGILVATYRDPGDGKLRATKLGDAIRKTFTSLDHEDAQTLRKHIQKSSQNQQDYEANSLVYPPSPNRTLLCAKSKSVQPQKWCLQ